MLVCDCKYVYYKEIKETVEQNGTDLETISKITAAGSSCGQCLGACDRVDITLPVAIEKAKNELAKELAK